MIAAAASSGFSLAWLSALHLGGPACLGDKVGRPEPPGQAQHLEQVGQRLLLTADFLQRDPQHRAGVIVVPHQPGERGRADSQHGPVPGGIALERGVPAAGRDHRLAQLLHRLVRLQHRTAADAAEEQKPGRWRVTWPRPTASRAV